MMKRKLTNLFRPWFYVKFPLINPLIWIAVIAFFSAWVTGEVEEKYLVLSIILALFSVLAYYIYPAHRIPIHPITVIMLASFCLNVLGFVIGIPALEWQFPIIVGLTILFWIWVRNNPLKPEEMTEREKDYYDNSRNHSR